MANADFAITIKANPSLTTQQAVREYIEKICADHPELHHYKGALVDIVNTAEDDAIECHNIPDMDDEGYEITAHGTRILWMPKIGRAACNSYQAGDWQWTDASGPEDALNRYRCGEMSP